MLKSGENPSFVTVSNIAGAAVLALVAAGAEVAPAARVVIAGIGFQVFLFAALQAHALWSPFVR